MLEMSGVSSVIDSTHTLINTDLLITYLSYIVYFILEISTELYLTGYVRILKRMF